MVIPQNGSFWNSTFEYYSGYGLMQLDSNELGGASKSVVTIERCTFDLTLKNESVLTHKAAYTNFVKSSVIGVRGLTVIRLVDNKVDWNNHIYQTVVAGKQQSPDLPIPWLEINTTTKTIDNCLQGNEFSGYILNLQGGNVSSCRNDKMFANEKMDMTCSDSPPPLPRTYITNKFYLTPRALLYNSSASSSKKWDFLPAIRIGGHERSLLVLDNANFLIKNGSDSTALLSNMTWEFVKFQSGFVSMFDVKLAIQTTQSKLSFFYPDQGCQQTCANTLSFNYSDIVQAYFNCQHSNESITTKTDLMQAQPFVSESLAAETIVYDVNRDVYPGGYLELTNFRLLDRNNHTTCLSNMSSFTLTLGIPDLQMASKTVAITKNTNDNCSYRCEECEKAGIRLFQLHVDDISHSFPVDVFLTNITLFVHGFSIHAIKCPAGYGVDTVSQICQECPQGTYRSYS
ncbi:hypothetical protein RFI_09706 [Reticulomyxa filosa]|uniref:Uncharacterized protein n=1 Tax=Reticulomyxa filosa TaxID=46433 RepID=X6NMF7_RETFI|nr:hypothetical protein RFI_09706 [Reticulomyxa filosa]|eukprot:ETO27425.1 hypothetical protein RFI_09706 [Reticulomyxa filosa]